MNVIKIILTGCQIYHLKCTKFNFGWGSTPDPARELMALPKTPSWIWEGKRKEKGREGRGRKMIPGF